MRPDRNRTAATVSALLTLALFVLGLVTEFELHSADDDRHHGNDCGHDASRRDAPLDTAIAAMPAVDGDRCPPCVHQRNAAVAPRTVVTAWFLALGVLVCPLAVEPQHTPGPTPRPRGPPHV